MVTVHHRTQEVDGLSVFYREAGDPAAPTIVLLHGYPTSSFMFRHLIPALGDRFHVVAPDHIGFGRSSAPSTADFTYTFDRLAEVTRAFLAAIGVQRYAVYVQDYGAPVGWRLALADPDRITAVISQNGNAYEEGFVEDFWAPVWAYGEDPSPEHESAVRSALGREAIEWQYQHGVPDTTRIDPDAWEHDIASMARPGIDRAMMSLFADYRNNRPPYPPLQAWFRERRIPLLAIWGRNDQIFAAAGAEAFRRDLPDAQVELLDAGHFALETDLDAIADAIRGWDALHR